MAEITESSKEADSQKDIADPKAVRDALLRLREFAANLPPIDAAALVRNIRETGSSVN